MWIVPLLLGALPMWFRPPPLVNVALLAYGNLRHRCVTFLCSSFSHYCHLDTLSCATRCFYHCILLKAFSRSNIAMMLVRWNENLFYSLGEKHIIWHFGLYKKVKVSGYFQLSHRQRVKAFNESINYIIPPGWYPFSRSATRSLFSQNG